MSSTSDLSPNVKQMGQNCKINVGCGLNYALIQYHIVIVFVWLLSSTEKAYLTGTGILPPEGYTGQHASYQSPGLTGCPSPDKEITHE